ncbi:MAG: hypothetical protein EBW68_11550 [Actinobacteria bacterium]|nr:hypothetical protein [Actinomycetota bacterium]
MIFLAILKLYNVKLDDPIPKFPFTKLLEPKVIKEPVSVILLSPIALAPVNLGKVFVVPVPVTGLVKAFCLLLNVLKSPLAKNPLADALA